MRKISSLLIGTSFLFTSILIQGVCFSQVEEEKQERVTQMQMLQKRKPSHKLRVSVASFAGYDNNVTLSPVRKGSVFEEFLYSIDFNKPLFGGLTFVFDYDLDFLNYHDVTKSSNLMNHLRLALDKSLNRFFSVGTGYDFSDFYYPNNVDGDFLFHKGFLYLKHSLSDKTYQRLAAEYGYKAHKKRKALADSLSQLQDKDLTDTRQSLEYSIVSGISPKLLVQFKTRFSKNDSNAHYLDYYDYKSYEFSPGMNYRLSEKLSLMWYMTYLRRSYTERTISTGTRKEKDNVYFANAGAKYRLNKNNVASLFYTYRDNATKEPLEKYTDSVFTLGWEYTF
jgi:hypothetical protein